MWKKFNLFMLTLVLSAFMLNAQTARLQVIHNSADFLAETVDVYVWNTAGDSLVVKLDDFAFRTATPFVDIPAGDSLEAIIAESNSVDETDNVLGIIPIGSLADMETYVLFANGVLDPNAYADNPEAISTAFELLVKPMAREAAVSENVEFFVLHGATDAPTVDVIARNLSLNATIVDNAPYTAMTDYIEVPADFYVLDVTPGSDNNTIVASFEADLSGLAGGSAVVFASGFLDPSANQNGEAFGIFAALADGTVIEFPAHVPSSRLQVIHNAADVAAASVDIYLWNTVSNSLVVKLDDFAFRAATPFVDVPANDALDVIIAAPSSVDETDQVIATIPVGALVDLETYVLFANGVLDPGTYAANPEARSTAFELLVKSMAREEAQTENVEFFVLHGATDAPAVDVIARGVATLVDNAAYTDMTDYIPVPAGSYLLDITPAEDNSTIVTTLEADLSGLGGGSAVVFASGFLTPSANQDGEAFGVFAALANGTVVEFPAYMPEVAAPTPTVDEADVISLFSNAYTDVTVDTWSAVWDVADVQDVQIAGDDAKLYTNLLYAGIEFTSQTIDATEMTHFHMDIWTPDATDSANFLVKLVDFGADGAFAGGDDTEDELTFTAPLLQTGSWVSIDIPLSDFVNMTAREHLAQLIISGDPNTVYVDNVYLYSVPKTARLQVIHNAADVAAASVDIYLWNTAADSLVIKLDDFAFRAATPFVDVPAGDELDVIIAAPTSANETDGVIATIPVGALAEMESYVVFANGVLDPGSYAANPEERSTAFELLVKPMAREAAVGSNVEFFVLHGATDAPTVDVIARGVAPLVDNAAYTDITDYIEVPAGSYTLDVTPGEDNSTIVASFEADLSGLGGGSAVVFASGFLNPAANQDGEAFSILAALADGTVVNFALITDISDVDGNIVPTNFSLQQNYPNPFNPSTVISFSLPKAENVSLKIYNILGSEITTLLSEELNAGNYQVDFNAANLASGTYFYKITAGNFTEVRKMNLIK